MGKTAIAQVFSSDNTEFPKVYTMVSLFFSFLINRLYIRYGGLHILNAQPIKTEQGKISFLMSMSVVFIK